VARYDFDAELWESDAMGAWVFVTVPGDISDDIRIESGPPAGFGSVRVEVTIGTTTWRTSVFPDKSVDAYVLPVKQAVRRAEGLEPGVTASVTVVLADRLPND
jgi:hypothetical protein